MKNFKITAALLFLATGAFAQNKNMEIGFEGGPTLSSFRGSAISDGTNSAYNFNAAAFFQYNLSDVFAVRTDVGYERKSFYRDVVSTDATGASVGSGNQYYNYDYVTLPILLRATTGGKNVQLFANVGPYFGFLLKASTTDYNGNLVYISTYNHVDFGVTGGLGLRFLLSDKVSLSAEVRDNLGLIDITTGIENLQTNSAGLLFGVGYKL